MKHEDIKLILNNDEYIGKEITVCGWIRAIRKNKSILFLEINDGTSLKNLQLVVDYALITVCKSTTLSFDGQTWRYGVCATTWPFAKKAVLLWHNNETINPLA